MPRTHRTARCRGRSWGQSLGAVQLIAIAIGSNATAVDTNSSCRGTQNLGKQPSILAFQSLHSCLSLTKFLQRGIAHPPCLRSFCHTLGMRTVHAAKIASELLAKSMKTSRLHL